MTWECYNQAVWELALWHKRGWFKWDLLNVAKKIICAWQMIYMRDFVGWGKTIQSCRGSNQSWPLNVALLKRQSFHAECVKNSLVAPLQLWIVFPHPTKSHIYIMIGNWYHPGCPPSNIGWCYKSRSPLIRHPNYICLSESESFDFYQTSQKIQRHRDYQENKIQIWEAGLRSRSKCPTC